MNSRIWLKAKLFIESFFLFCGDALDLKQLPFFLLNYIAGVYRSFVGYIEYPLD